MYQQKLGFPVILEKDNEIRFLPTPHFTLSFIEVSDPLSPAHFAFEVPHSTFNESAAFLRDSGIPLVQWPDGREIDEFETGKNLYFRDGDGNCESRSKKSCRQGVSPRRQLQSVSIRGRRFATIDLRYRCKSIVPLSRHPQWTPHTCQAPCRCSCS